MVMPAPRRQRCNTPARNATPQRPGCGPVRVAVTGPNGCGKGTLLRVIAGCGWMMAAFITH